MNGRRIRDGCMIPSNGIVTGYTSCGTYKIIYTFWRKFCGSDSDLPRSYVCNWILFILLRRFWIMNSAELIFSPAFRG